MTECPACGADVPSDGRYCPSCGREIATDAESSQSPIGHRRPGDSDRVPADTGGTPRDSQRRRPEERRRPRAPGGASRQEPNPAEHKLLVGSVGGLSVIGLLDGISRVTAPGEFTQQLMEASQDTGMELEPGFAEQLVVGTGAMAILLSLLVVGLTARNYRNRQLPRRYFWVLIVTGAAGFILASNLFLTLLVGFGIYGLVSVTN